MASIEVRKALELTGKVMRLSQDIAGTLATASDIGPEITEILNSLDAIYDRSMWIESVLTQIGHTSEV